MKEASSRLKVVIVGFGLGRILNEARNVRKLLAEVVGFDTDARRVKLSDGAELEYDYLNVAAGARHSYFGNDEWKDEAPRGSGRAGIRRRDRRAYGYVT